MKKIIKNKLAGDKMKERWLHKKFTEENIKKFLKKYERSSIIMSGTGLDKLVKSKKPRKRIYKIKIGDVIRFRWSADRTIPYYYKWRIGKTISETNSSYEIKVLFSNNFVTDFLNKRKYIIEKATKKEKEAYENIENMILAKEVADKL